MPTRYPVRTPVLVLAVFAALAAAVPAAALDDAARDTLRQALLYGIDSQALDAVKALGASWDAAFAADCAAVLGGRRSASVQAAVYDLFREKAVPDGEKAARSLLGDWEGRPPSLVAAGLKYMGAIHAQGIVMLATPFLASGDAQVWSAAVQALASSGDQAAAEPLLASLAGFDVPESRKPDLVLALGTLRAPSAVDALIAIAANVDEQRIRRLYAADSLSKIGDPKALPVLRSMFEEDQALVRQYAASSLARFPNADVFDDMLEGLRDEDAKVRESCAGALARGLDAGKAAEAVPVLSYKAEQDPSAAVRAASMKALGAIGGDAAVKKLIAIYGGADRPLESREAALAAICSGSLAAASEAVRKVIADELKASESRISQGTARVLSAVRDPLTRPLLVMLLDSADPVARGWAIRGIAFNGFSDLKERLKTMAAGDASPSVRREAEVAAAKL